MAAESDHDTSQDDDPVRVRTTVVVGVGASAGGLQALQEFFREVPEDLDAAYVVVQHLSPDFESHMEQLLTRETDLAIERVVDGVEVTRGTIYLIPPAKSMVIEQGRLLLSDREPGGSPAHPIDRFFRSLAKDAGEHSAAIVLSGTGTDGSNGLIDVAKSGGLAMAQEPSSASFPGMPDAAIETGQTHFTHVPTQLARAIARYLEESLKPEEVAEQDLPEMSHDELPRLFDALQAEFGIDFSVYKKSTVGRRIDRRLIATQSRSLRAYVDEAVRNQGELEELYRDLLINVTRFRRDEEAFAFIESDILDDVIGEGDEDTPIRVWIAGCSTGEEAYTVAISIAEHLRETDLRRPVRIFATDVDQEALDAAGAGIYSEDALKAFDEEVVERHFERTVDGFLIRRNVRDQIVFARHDLLVQPPFMQVDLLCCRNVLIYFQPRAQERALALFHFSLRVGGYLFLGPSESTGALSDEFSSVDSRWRVFKKRRDVHVPTRPIRSKRSGDVSGTPAGHREARGVPRRASQRNAQWSTATTRNALYVDLLESRLPPSVLVDANFNVLHLFGGVENLLSLRPGRFSSNLLDLVTDEVRPAIAGALRHALERATPVRFRGLELAGEDTSTNLSITVERFTPSGGGDQALLIEFEVRTRASVEERTVDLQADTVTLEHVRALEYDLSEARENLQATVEELETSNEELQASNEELVASNEELQSTNEELHSVNEELYTVNGEHEARIDELSRETADMDNLLAATRVGVLFLDVDLRIRRFTPAIAKVFDLVDHDIGRKISTFTNALDFAHLSDAAQQTLDGGEPYEVDVRDRAGEPYLLRLLPYKRAGKTRGVVVTLVDIASLVAAEDELERFRFIVEQAADMYSLVDDEGKVVYGNSSFRRALGLPSVGMLDIAVCDFDSEIARRDFDRFARDVVEEDGLVIASTYKRADGTMFPVDLSFTPVQFSRERYYFVHARDITARRRAEHCEKLIREVSADALVTRSEEAMLEGVVRASFRHLEIDAIDVWVPTRAGLESPKDLSFIRAFADRRGDSDEPFGLGLPPDEEIELLIRSALESDVLLVADDDHTSASHELYRAFAVVEKGVVYAVLTFRLLPELAADPALLHSTSISLCRVLRMFFARQSSERLLALRDRAIQASRDGIVIASATEEEFPVVYVNRGFEQITGYSSSEILHRNCRFLQGEGTRPEVRARIRAALESGEATRETILNYRKDGTPFWNELQLSPIENEGGDVEYFLAVQHDVTERIRTENELRRARREATAASEAKSRFLATMSHELRSPMTAILGFTDAIARRSPDAEVQEMLTTIRGNADHLLELLNDILDISKIEAGKLSLATTETDLHDLLQNVVELMKVRADERSLELLIEVASPIPRTIRIDRTRLRQVLVNLLANAIKFTDRGTVTLRVDFEQTGERKGRLLFGVIDTGIGIASEQLEVIFKPFTRPHAESDVHTAEYEGSGLGLSIVRRLVTAMDGNIEVSSEPGRGSDFRVALPVEIGGDASFSADLGECRACEDTPSGVETNGNAPALEGLRILVVDDRPDVAAAVEFYLTDAGASAVKAENGQEAVDKVAQTREKGVEPFDAIVLDMQMPVLDGYAAARRLREEGFDVPIIALTAGAMKEDVARCMEAGCNAFLSKPAEELDLLRVVAEQCGRGVA